MASARNLCQHSDNDGTNCISDDYIHCPHCQLQLCLKHLNYHQDLLRSDLHLLCDNINRVRSNLDHLIFDSTNHREDLFEKLDNWYQERLNILNKIYFEKKQQLNILCLQAQMEFDAYKSKKDKQLKDNLFKQLKKVLKQKQIHIDDLNTMKYKLDDIERGLDELKQLLIDINHDETSFDIQIIKRRYVEAAKSSINDDEDDIWDNEDEDEKINSTEADIILLSPPDTSPQPIPTSSTTIVKKAPLKFVIKRLNHPTTSTKVKYKFHTIPTSPQLIT